MNYQKKYEKYKLKYLRLKGGQQQNDDLILIVGKPASGKSTVAKQFEKSGYYLISMDEVIREKLIPIFKDQVDQDRRLFRIYRDKYMGPVIEKARRVFIGIMKKLIKEKKEKGVKVVVEGAIMHNQAINEIFGEKFTIYFVKPKDEKSYLEMIKQRFIEDPEKYGRLGFLLTQDKDGKALEDYKKNGINGNIISDFLKRIGQEEYKDIHEWLDVYKNFNVKIYLN